MSSREIVFIPQRLSFASNFKSFVCGFKRPSQLVISYLLDMPKRSCPFTETFSSQYKIHVSQRELSNQGVFGNKYRQEIYGKRFEATPKSFLSSS